MQKLILVLIMMLFVSFLCQAQITAKKVLLGGNISFSSNNDENPNNSRTYLSLLPSILYMVNNNIGLGVGIGYLQGQSESKQLNYNGTTSTSSISFNPYARYYKAIAGSEMFYFFGQVNLSLSFGNEKNTQTNINFSNSRSINTFGAFISPNFAFLPSKRWAVELGFNGIGYSITDPEGNNNNSSYFNFGVNSFAANIGVRYIF